MLKSLYTNNGTPLGLDPHRLSKFPSLRRQETGLFGFQRLLCIGDSTSSACSFPVRRWWNAAGWGSGPWFQDDIHSWANLREYLVFHSFEPNVAHWTATGAPMVAPVTSYPPVSTWQAGKSRTKRGTGCHFLATCNVLFSNLNQVKQPTKTWLKWHFLSSSCFPANSDPPRPCESMRVRAKMGRPNGMDGLSEVSNGQWSLVNFQLCVWCMYTVYHVLPYFHSACSSIK